MNQLNFIGLSIVENKKQINKILKNSPEVFGSGRSVELLKRFIEVSIRPVLNFKMKQNSNTLLSLSFRDSSRFMSVGSMTAVQKAPKSLQTLSTSSFSEHCPNMFARKAD